MNNVNLIGRIVSKPELVTTQTNKTYTKFTLAISRNHNSDDTDFIRCVAWDKKADVLNKYTDKGSLIGINGEIRSSNYENTKGEKVYLTEVNVSSIKLLDKKAN